VLRAMTLKFLVQQSIKTEGKISFKIFFNLQKII